MKLYLIGGLGADKRVFDYLDLEVKSTVVEWIDPNPNEDIDQYALRLSSQIDTSQDFGLLGVSFGGLIATEISKLHVPKCLILISSVSKDNQLPSIYLFFGKLGILKLLPNSLIKPPKFLQRFLFGAQNKDLLYQIILDTSPSFVKWALNAMVNWNNSKMIESTYRIHGTHDRLIPLSGDAIKIQNGGHFMIVDRAKEISKLVNQVIKKERST